MTNFCNKTNKENLKKYMLSANFQASIIVVVFSGAHKKDTGAEKV